MPSLDVLTGKALVRILHGNDHILGCRILPQLVTLGIQAVPVYLHGGGHSCIKIAFTLIIKGRKTIDQVPAIIRDEVKQILKDLEVEV